MDERTGRGKRMKKAAVVLVVLLTLVLHLDFQRQHITVYLETQNGIVQSEASAKSYVCGWMPENPHLATWSVAIVDKIKNTVHGTTVREFCGL